MEGISEMFAEFSGADEYEAQVTIEWWVRQRCESRRESRRTYLAVMRKVLNERERQRYASSAEYRTIKNRKTVARRNRDDESRAAYRIYMREYYRRKRDAEMAAPALAATRRRPDVCKACGGLGHRQRACPAQDKRAA